MLLAFPLFVVATAATASTTTTTIPTPRPRRVLVIGGSGRVGGSAVRHLQNIKSSHNLEVCVAGRRQTNWQAYVQRQKDPSAYDGVPFLELDVDGRGARLDAAVKAHDLIIHTAGPFQGLTVPSVMESALKHGKLYLDVCDDVALSRVARSPRYQEMAAQHGGAAIISTGIWPGGSSLLAQRVVEEAGGHANVDKCVFKFFTAGSGGAGPTILTATFLILGENVLTYEKGQAVYKVSATDPLVADFGAQIGPREVVRLNLIECESCFVSGVPSVETYFGTAPPFWNTLFVWMAKLIPQRVLQRRDLMATFARFSLPAVRVVDTFVGSKNGIRIDVKAKDGRTFTGLLTHLDMEKAVGDAIGAFAVQLLQGAVSTPGVYFPEEIEQALPNGRGKQFRDEVLAYIAADAITYMVKEN
jgi:saccharopine dehydrogenase-like NADP-dependent oxidoreductase